MIHAIFVPIMQNWQIPANSDSNPAFDIAIVLSSRGIGLLGKSVEEVSTF